MDNDILNLIGTFVGDESSKRNNVRPITKDDGKNNKEKNSKQHSCLERSRTASRHRRAAFTDCQVIIFSKDRPWQLQQLLRSMKLNNNKSNHQPQSSTKINPVEISVTVILCVEEDDLFCDGYRTVQQEFDNVQFCHETTSSSFENILTHRLSTNQGNIQRRLVAFFTDDCILLEDLCSVIDMAASAIGTYQNRSRERASEHHRVACFLSRLHPGISWCQTRGKPCPLPRNLVQYHYHGGNGMSSFYSYYNEPTNAQQILLDWNYPFDLSGGFYPEDWIDFVLIPHLQRTNPMALSHPNKLEIGGNQAFKELQTKKESVPLVITFPSEPLLRILAMNRVQTVHRAPIGLNGEEFSPENLIKNLGDGIDLDIARYKYELFNSSHLEEVYFKTTSSSKQSSLDHCVGLPSLIQPCLSILMPVHTGPPTAASLAMRSTMSQIIDMDPNLRSGMPVQFVLIDDRCYDGSIDAMVNEAKAIANSSKCDHMSFVVFDNRPNLELGSSMAMIPDPGETGTQMTTVCISIDLYASPQKGVAAALQFGLTKCHADFVARIDADDICCPGRLAAQLQALRYNASLDVVGTQIMLFTETESADVDEDDGEAMTSSLTTRLPYVEDEDRQMEWKCKTNFSPTDAAFLPWAMLFSCCIAHPSVMYRKAAVAEAGGYNITNESSNVEDYDLWLRMLSKKPAGMVSLPMIGLWHRKHRDRSRALSKKQEQQGDLCSLGAVQRLLLDDTIPLNLVQLLRGHFEELTSITVQDIDDSTRLLLKIEEKCKANLDCLSSNRVAKLIEFDCTERLGELVAHLPGMTSSDRMKTSIAWKIWCDRTEQDGSRQLERVALLLSAGKGEEKQPS